MRDLISVLKSRPWAVALLLAVAAQIFFTINIDRPGRVYFDEVHYLPAALSLLDQDAPRNIEHPLVGKEFMALGMAIFGDNPLGWRIFSSLAGTATVVAAFAFLWLLFGSIRAALVGAALTVLNQILYIQARIGMLDVFLGAFLMWAIVAMLWARHGTRRQIWGRWLLAALFFGLAVGSKWSAIPYVAAAGLTFVALRVRDALRVVDAKQPGRARKVATLALRGVDQPNWPGLPTIPALLVLGTLSIFVYLATFLPAFFYHADPLTLGTLIPFQLQMYEAQTQILPAHTYQSDWWSWPLILRPMWYFYEWWDDAQRGVLLIGNPLIMWGGLIGVLACLYGAWRKRSWTLLGLGLLWVFSVGIYAIIPKSLGFYYYYHPSALFLCLALAGAFHVWDAGRGKGWEEWFLAGSLLVFIWFYPVLSAAALEGDAPFTRWTLFDSWR